MQNVNVNGSDNEVLVAGGDVYQVHLHLFPPSDADRQNLLNLLGRVRESWITGVLERSVGPTARLQVGMTAVPGQVEHPCARQVEVAGGDRRVLPPGTSIGQVFDEAGRTLLVLGEPGAGKTTTLLTLARECIQRAEDDPAAPVPVVLNLSTWADSRKTIFDWMVGELATTYSVGRPLARQWLREHRLLPLLDGLDEVAAARRAACVEALHAFVQGHGVPGLAICCRAHEYRALPVRLKLGGAVSLLPLTPEQVSASLDRGGPALAGLRAALGRNPELRALAASPLMLNLMTVAFAGAPGEALEFGHVPGRNALRGEIFRRYVERMFVLRTRFGGVSRARTEGWLRWLAKGMMGRGESIFATELLQPAWLTPRQLLLYTLVSRVAGGVALAAVIGAVVCLGIYSLLLMVDPPSRHALTSTGLGTVAMVVAAYLMAAVATGTAMGLLYAPFDYLRFRCSCLGQPRELSIRRELARFLGYVGLTILGVAFVAAGAGAVKLSPRAPHLSAAVITVLASVPSFPLFFWRKAGRGAADGDIGLAGTLTWRWRSSLEIAAVGLVAGGIVLPFSGWLEVSRMAALALSALVVVMAVVYGSWRHEVPPPERWANGTAGSALGKSGRIFVYGWVAWVLALFPVLWLTTGPWASPAGPLLLASMTAIVLQSPALFWFGGLDAVLHASLRLVLSLTGDMPLRLRRFLDHGVHLGFLQRAGGGYIFIHRLLLEHFAARPPRSASTTPP
ncbi:MAG TPA: NACHT domain-containing protein [Longimicrobium sp.]|nr:NACHT domain-containing protein [Longimicrobium sp.]